MTGIIKTDQLKGAQSSTITIPTGNKISITDSATIGTVTATNIGGTLTTAAQTNVTSLGTLTGLTSTGRINVNFNGSGTQAFKYTDTGGGNLASFGQYYNTSDGLIGNVQNANNDGIHLMVKNGSICFTQTGYVSANALDDYEEGTWTATFTGSASNPSTSVTTTANYIKVGRLVYVTFAFANVNTSGATGEIRITGLPFTPSPGNQMTGDVTMHTLATITSGSANVSPFFTSTYIAFYSTKSASAWSGIQNNAGAGGYLYCAASYLM